MKIKIIDCGSCPYITLGKVYDVIAKDDKRVGWWDIIDDEGDTYTVETLDDPENIVAVEVVDNDPMPVVETEDFLDQPTDNVNNPSHYGNGQIECIDYLEDFMTTEEFIGYLRGNIGKYLHRWRYKNGLEDLHKAEWYLKKLIEVYND